jgi:hypothetical protein
LSEAIGQPLELQCCKLDGHGTCQFKPVQKNPPSYDAPETTSLQSAAAAQS